MGLLHIATGLNRWIQGAEAKTLHAGRLNIGPRLILGFVFIILSMLAADAVVLWQFRVARAQAARLDYIDQKLVAVLRVHTGLLTLHDRLDALAHTEDADRLVREAGPLRLAVSQDISRAISTFRLLPSDLQRDPTIVPSLLALQSALPQLDAITTLGASGDWQAVDLRLANQIRPLHSQTSALVERVEHEVSEEQAQTAQNITRVQQRVFLIVPLTAVLSLLIAGTLGLAITRSITQPLERLMEGSKALARGEFDHQVPVTGKDELAHLGQVFNITAGRLRELYASLQSSEDRLRLVIDTIPAHVWSARPDGAVDFINRRWLETTGLSLESGLGWAWGSVIHPDDLASFVERWHAALAAGEPMESESRLRRADGQYRWWLIRNVPLRDGSRNIVKWYGTAVDIEERKRAEEEREKLRQAEGELARVTRVATMGELTASLAHEIKQPITAAVTNARTCLRWLGRDEPDMAEAREAALRLVSDVTRASDIISSINLLFKKDALQRELVDVNGLIREMIVLLRSEANRYSISIRTELMENLPRVMADRVQLQQVFMNLMLNGIEAMKDMTVTSELSINSQQVTNDQLLISISDTGVGLPQERVHQIFDAFFTTKSQGLGMGLAISRSIVESHGGRLWAIPHSGPGATFQFTLPSEAAAHQAA
jgi:PAS domain S-box-containing protein